MKTLVTILILVALSSALTRKPIANFTSSGGTAVALSLNNGTLAVAFFNPANSVQLFAESSGQWNQIATLTISNSEAYVTSLALTQNYLLVGTLFSGNDYGAAYIFEKPANGWTDAQETATLLPSDPTPDSAFGWTVAAYGPTAVVTGNGPNFTGVGYVYEEPANGWQNAIENARLTASDATFGDAFGYSVAVAGVPGSNGSEITVGSPDAGEPNQYQGAVYVYDEPSGGWSNMTETAKLTDSSGKADYEMGWSVAMSENTVVAVAPGVLNGHYSKGVVKIYVKPESGWNTTSTPSAKLFSSTASFIDSVGITQSGTQIIACCGSSVARIAPDLGFLFTEPSTGWANATAPNFRLLAPGSDLRSAAIGRGLAAVGGSQSSNGVTDLFVAQ